MDTVLSITDWMQIAITFKGKCQFCAKEVLPGLVFWSKSTRAVKHLTCKEPLGQSLRTNQASGNQTDTERKWKDRNLATKLLIVKELVCYNCGNKTGCNGCSFMDNCDGRQESHYCICGGCLSGSEGKADVYQEYQQAFLKKSGKITRKAAT